MRTRYRVPTHMALADKLLFGLTARQLLTLLVGGALAYQIWVQTGQLGLSRLGLTGIILQGSLVGLVCLVSILIAFVSIAGRPLELWLLVGLRYRQIPRRYTWCSLRSVSLSVPPKNGHSRRKHPHSTTRQEAEQ